MSYVDAIHDKNKDIIKVVERVNGKRVFKEYPASYVFYYENPHGTHRTMWGEPCVKYQTHSSKKFLMESRAMRDKKLHESDINPIFRCLEENYLKVESPSLNVGFFDIEVDFDPQRGFASPWDPFARITAISIYLSHLEKNITLVLKPDLKKDDPDYLSWDEAHAICSEFEDTMLCNDEEELLRTFVDLCEDVDILSGWNSKGFDIPYIINRIDRLINSELSARLCLWGQKPKKKGFIKFKQEQFTYELSGRVHLDYLELYQKYTYKELHSYRLDFIGELEVGENKVPYDGTLDALYKKDFRKFIDYNRQDVMLLVKIDRKCRFIELSNQLAHTNTVLLQTTMGSVAIIEQAIVNETHHRGMVVCNRKNRFDEDDSESDTEQMAAVGAYVAVPKIGLQTQIGACDINSLYPSALRSLNMGPETLIGQVRSSLTDKIILDRMAQGTTGPEAWHEIFCLKEFDLIHEKSDTDLVVDFETGETVSISAKDLHELIFHKESNYVISANGTIFRKDVEAIIPGLLTKWYAERKEMQAKEREFKKLESAAHQEGDFEKEKEYHAQVLFWGQRQLARKILLNSLYGAILNQGCRFYDHRIGQSVTLTGRSIARHMNATINKIITGVYDYKGDAIIYADTDSSYFSAARIQNKSPELSEILNDRSKTVEYYDAIGDETNNSFPEFMNITFNTGLERGAIIRAGREIVGAQGLFITKKRYAILVYDDEGKRVDIDGKPGKMKVMGLDLKRSDTPKFMQDFLEHILTDLLNGGTEEEIINQLRDFRQHFRKMDPWLQGTPKKVNGITGYQNKVDDATSGVFKSLKSTSDKKNVMVPGHVRAAMNWNILRDVYKDHYSTKIVDGAKVIVCKLKKNPMNFDSIAYPADDARIPDWFKTLPFDTELMEETIIDKKIENLLGVLKWNLDAAKENSTFDDLFSF